MRLRAGPFWGKWGAVGGRGVTRPRCGVSQGAGECGFFDQENFKTFVKKKKRNEEKRVVGSSELVKGAAPQEPGGVKNVDDEKRKQMGFVGGGEKNRSKCGGLLGAIPPPT